MKNIIYLILVSFHLYGASLTINEAKDHNISYTIMHIKNDLPFVCEMKMQDDFSNKVICTFSTDLQKNINTSNRHFQVQSNKNQLVITPLKKVDIAPVQKDYVTDNILKSNTNVNQPHWLIIGYEGQTPLLQQQLQEPGLDFDVVFKDYGYPFIGTLDLDGLPIVQNDDAKSMVRIREAYEEGRYENVLQLVDNLLERGNNDYNEEAKLYRIRAEDKIAWQSGDSPKIDTEQMSENCTEWISENPSSKHLPEVLMYLSKIYYKLGRVNKADEYTQILTDTFPNDEHTYLAQIYQADRIFESRKRRKEALGLYEDVLYNTKDLNVASMAASKLTDKYLTINDINAASEFYNKILEANEPYIIDHADDAYAFAKRFADEKAYDMAIKIVGTLLSHKRDDDDHDTMRKDIAYWYELSGNKEAAFGLYKQYLDDFPRGKFRDFIQKRLDKLLLDVDETNRTKKMQNIEKILKEYPSDPVYQKALIEKAVMLIEDNDFKTLFEMEQLLKENNGSKFLQYGASKKIIQDLNAGACKEAIYLYNEYNATVPDTLDVQLYDCLMRVAEYKKALTVTEKNLATDDLEKKAAWMYREIKVQSKLDNNKKLILIAQDLEKLSKILKTDRYDDIVYEKAEAYYNLQNYDDLMLEEVRKIEKNFADNIRNIDLYNKVLRYAKSQNNDLLTAEYAQKIITLQKLHKIDDYSPNVELDRVNALKRLGEYDKALKDDLELLYMELNDTQKANVLYLAGELSLKLGQKSEAREFLLKCGEIVEDNAWQRLCAQSLKLLEE